MTNEQLCTLAKSGDQSARSALLESNTAFVHKEACDIWNGNNEIMAFLGIEVEDLEQEGALGLLQCIDRFDEKKNIKFLTYAATAIRNAMLDTLRRQENLCPTDNMKELDREDPAATPEQQLMQDDSTETLDNALDRLTERERAYLQYRFGLDGEGERSREETAQHFRLSTNRAKRLEESALKKLREVLT